MFTRPGICSPTELAIEPYLPHIPTGFFASSPWWIRPKRLTSSAMYFTFFRAFCEADSTRRWKTQAVTLISTVRKILHPDIIRIMYDKKKHQNNLSSLLYKKNNSVTEQCANYAMNWWTLLRGIPCSPHGGTGQGVAMRPQTKQQNRQALGSQWVPHGPTLSMVWWCLLITTATHWHESSCEYRICGIAWEMPGISGNYLAVSVKKKFQLSGTPPHFLGSHLDPAAMMEFGDWHFFWLFIGII